MNNIESSLEDNPNYRFTPLGPDSAAGVIAAVFIIMIFPWLYILARHHRFLIGSVIRMLLYTLIGAVGYILRIVCNSQIPGANSTSDQINNFINLYIAANVMSSIGNFILFNAITAVGNAWVESNRRVSDLNQIYFERRIFRYFTLATLVALILNIVASSNNRNDLRIASNSIFVALLVILLLAIIYYSATLDTSYNRSNDYNTSKGTSEFLSNPHTIPKVLFVCTFLLLVSQAYKLAQSVVPVGTVALTSIPLIYILGPALNLVVLIILTVTWVPTFYNTLWERRVAFERSQTEYLQSQQGDDYQMNQRV
ncbi:hypothetical protein BGW37DRAFT_286166 [Umbelopsis sp. PMI_123]|nr:hypothetical protein BGW37DRAFT_286166 [Umbelopsis sp. PMI_123]